MNIQRESEDPCPDPPAFLSAHADAIRAVS